MKYELQSEVDTKNLGERLGAQLRGGEVIELIGDVGAGKTTFVKGLAKGLEIDEDIQSPSFTISRVYDARDGLTLAHYDFYRLQDPGILAAELDEIARDTNVVTVIEWAGIVENALPDDRMVITITPLSETSRQLTLKSEAELPNIAHERP